MNEISDTVNGTVLYICSATDTRQGAFKLQKFVTENLLDTEVQTHNTYCSENERVAGQEELLNKFSLH
jgi:hypothetical protein